MPHFITFDCCNQPVKVCDTWAEVGKGEILIGWSPPPTLSVSISHSPRLSHRSKWVQLVVILTSMRRDVTCRPTNTHTLVQQLHLPAKCSRVGMRACVCKIERAFVYVCLSVFVLLNPPVPFHLEVRGQQSNQSQLPSAPRLDTSCVRLPVCVCCSPYSYPFLKVPTSLCVCWHVCDSLDLCSCMCMCVFSPPAIFAL